MKIYTETNLNNFEFWSAGEDTAVELTPEEIDTIEGYLDELYPEGIDETALNDFFWFERETIAEWLGFGSFDEIMERNK